MVELRKLLGRRLVKLILVLPILPILLSITVRAKYHAMFEALKAAGLPLDRLWLAVLGSTQAFNIGELPAAVSMGLTFSNVASFAWLVSILFAALAFASDAGNGRLSLIALRPVSRPAIAVAKTLASTLALTILYLEAAGAAYASAAIAVGHQSYIWLIPVYSVLMAAASLPLLLLTGVIGLRLARAGATFAVGLVAYVALGIAATVTAFISAGSLHRASSAIVLANVLEPIHSYMLPRIALNAAVLGLHHHYIMFEDTGLTLGYLLAVSAASTAAGIAALLAFAAYYISGLDLKAP